MPEFPGFTGLGKMLMFLGLAIAVLGVIISLLGKWTGDGIGLGWLGKLPGDLFIKRDNVTFYFPLTTSIIISIVGSLLLYLFMKR